MHRRRVLRDIDHGREMTKAADRKFRGFANTNISWGGFQNTNNLCLATRRLPFAPAAICNRGHLWNICTVSRGLLVYPYNLSNLLKASTGVRGRGLRHLSMLRVDPTSLLVLEMELVCALKFWPEIAFLSLPHLHIVLPRLHIVPC